MPRRQALLVEDDHSSSLVAKTRLELLGFEVTVATDAFEARRMLDEEKTFDLLVLDYRLPGMNGGELATVLRASRRHLHLPILLVTADMEVALQGIVDHILRKPYERNDFNRAIEKVMSQRTADA